MSNYKGVEKFGWYALLEGSDRQANGDTWFVDGNSGNAANSAGTGQGASWDLPFANINYAISRCSNDAGDIIFVASGHTEAIADTSDTNTSGTVTDEFCVDKSGVTIIGMGTGDLRPVITLAGATDATIDVRASECILYNLIFNNNLADVVTMIDAQAAADGLVVDRCRFSMSSNAVDPILMINLTANCDDVTIKDCRFYATAANDATLAAIKFEGGCDRARLIDNHFYGDWNEQVIDADTAASTEVEVAGNVFYNVDTVVANAIDFHDSTTGSVTDNIIYVVAGGTGGGAIVAVGCVKAGNLITTSLTDEATASPPPEGGVSSLHQVYYLDDGTGSDANDGKSWSTAFATIGTAIDATTANNGDIIYVAAGFAQTITGVGTTTDFDVDTDGISIIGLGQGVDRPTFTMDTSTANAQCYVTGVDCKLENLVFLGTLASLAELINVNADGLQVINCEFDDDGTDEPLSCITIDTSDTTGGSRTVIKGCVFDMTSGGACNTGILINKDLHDIVIEDNTFKGDYAVACISTGSASNVSKDLLIRDNQIQNDKTGIPCVVVYPGVTGVIKHNLFISDTRDEVCGPGSCNMVDNLWADVAADAGAVLPFNDPTRSSGQIFFVDSGATRAVDQVGNGQSWDEPFATLDYAIAFCTASSGAEIHLAPGHAENCDTAGTHIDLDVAGVKVIGHGTGTDRPTFTFITEVTGDIEINAANCSIENCIFINDVTGLDAPINIDAAGFTMKNCVTRDLATDICDNWIFADGGADYLTIEGHAHQGTASANGVTWLAMSAAADFLTVKDCYINGNFTAACIDFAAAVGSVLIDNCTLINANAVDVCFEGFAASTGVMRNCSLSILTDGQTTAVNTPGSMSYFENYFTDNPVGEAGILCVAAGLTGA